MAIRTVMGRRRTQMIVAGMVSQSGIIVASREKAIQHSAVTAAARRGAPGRRTLQFDLPSLSSCGVSVVPTLL